MNKRLTAVLLAVMIMAAAACSPEKPKENAKTQEYLQKIEYSNLADEKTVKEVQKLMDEAGISAVRQKDFFANVERFNQSVKKEHLTNGYEIAEISNLGYDTLALQEEWMKNNPDFDGTNCRITCFGLFGDLVELDKNAPKREDWILTDMPSVMSLSETSEIMAQDGAVDQYKVLYSAVLTDKSEDVQTHVKKVQEDWKEREIKFKDNPKARLISVFFHDNLDEQNKLFIGHIGLLLVKSENELYFVEKVNFQEPYQVIKFKNRVELNDYLMSKYDIEWGQATAIPFIMENDQLMEGYRPNLNKKNPDKQ